MQKISPFLWFNDQAEQAAEFYVSVFKNSKINHVSRYGEAGPGPAGQAMAVSFTLDGEEFTGLNGGPMYSFTPAVSFLISCDSNTQEEVDYYWDKLTAGGKASQCGWLEDKYGLSWQVVPPILMQLIGGPDKAGATRAMQAMMKMGKIVIQDLKDAYEGK